MKRIGLIFLLFIFLTGSLPARSAVNPPAQPQGASPASAFRPDSIPAPIQGAPKPTIQVSPNHGLPGAALAVSGQGVAPYPGVRLVWLDEETTATLQVVDLDGSGDYNAAIHIPDTLSPGPGRVCAAVTGTDLAAFECVVISVDAPTPGSLSGALPLTGVANRSPALPSAIDASLNLYDQQGNIVAGVPIQNNGTFTLNNVPPGTYTAGVAGSVPVPVQNGTVIVRSGQQATFNPVPYEQCTKASVVAVRLTPTGKATSIFDFGSYANYWPYTEAGPKVVFQVDMQVINGATLGLIAVKVDQNDGGEWVFAAVDPPASGSTYEFSRWVADADVGIRDFSFEPIVSYPTQGCQVEFASRRVHIIEHPMQINPLQGYNDRRVNDLVWDGNQYVFDVKIHSNYDGYPIIIPFFSIDGEKKLPVTFPDPPPALDYLGLVENINGGSAYNMVGTLDLDGNVTFQMLHVRSRSSPMNIVDAIKNTAPLLPEGSSLPTGIRASAPSSGIPAFALQQVGTDLVERLRQVNYDIPPTTLFDFSETIPVYEGVIFSAAGLANLRVSISLNINGDMLYQGTIRPLAPEVSALGSINVRPSLDIEVIIDALFGVASAGGTAHTEAEVRFPIQMDSNDDRYVWMPDPCMKLKVTFYLWVRANLLFASGSWSSDPEVLLDYTEGICHALENGMQSPNAPSQDPPRLLAAPSVTSGPGGRMLAAYIEDSAPDAPNPAPRVMARFWDAANEQWGAAAALTDGAHMVQDPAAAFYGPNGRAMVAWTENPISLVEEEAAGEDLNAILKRQEIYYATYDGSQWSAPVRLTNDLLPDGQAAIAGDNQGITLAWLSDTDENLGTRLDWRIAVREWNGSSWTDVELLNGSVLEASNYQVSVDRQEVSGNSERVLAWTVDGDGDLGTTGDRHIEVFDWDGTTWKKDATNSLPLRAEAPQVAFIPGGQDVYMTYIVRNNDKSGSSGGLGNTGVLQTARRDYGSGWSKFPVLDVNGDAVRVEEPRLDVGPDGEALVLMRRFGAVSTNGELGQMAYSQLKDTGEAYPPLYLTDEARQHWQPALAINQASSQAVFLDVNRSAPLSSQTILAASPLKAASTGVHPDLGSVQLSTASDPVESALIEPGADPALDPGLQVSQYHADPGATVMVTTTVRNIGRGIAEGVVVSLYSGEDPGGTLIDYIPIGDLAFNQSQTITFTVAAEAGSQPVYAKVTASSANINTANDTAAASLGQLLVPEMVYIQPSPTEGRALQVAWQAPAMPGIAGFRVLRSLTSGGPYELVGETTRTLYTDLLLQGGTTYYYVVQTFDAGGAVSAFSAEVSATLPSRGLYLPMVVK